MPAPSPQTPFIASLLFSVALLLIPAGVYLERALPNAWISPLFNPAYLKEPAFHTPLHSTGTYVPSIITRDTILNANQNPIILTQVTQVAPHTTLTIEPGTKIYTNEFSSLSVAGNLNIKGTASDPVKFNTNEVHPDNQSWNGIVFLPGSSGTITHTRLENGVPALTCEHDSHVNVLNSFLSSPILAVFLNSSDCQITSSRIVSAHDGIHLTKNTATLSNLTYSIAKRAVVQY